MGEKDVSKMLDLLIGIDSAAKNRSQHKANILMQLKVAIKFKDGTTRTSTANFMDLIASNSKLMDKSLTSLSEIANALSDGVHVNHENIGYKDSKLTHVLAHSLGGNCRTTLVVAVSPHKYNRK